MPLQFLLLFAAAFVLFIAGQHILKKCGRPVTAFWQAILIWLAAYGILKGFVHPPLPSSLLYTYMGVVTVATFFFVSAAEETWNQCRKTVEAFFTRDTRWARAVRVFAFAAAPVLAFFAAYDSVVPTLEEPAELRHMHPAPPRTITVHGVRVDLQTAKNPFRIDEGLQPPGSGR
jgi:hypothetical protein